MAQWPPLNTLMNVGITIVCGIGFIDLKRRFKSTHPFNPTTEMSRVKKANMKVP